MSPVLLTRRGCGIGGSGRVSRRLGWAWGRTHGRTRLSRRPECGVVARASGLQRLNEVVDEVEAIGDLIGVRRPRTRALGIGAPAIPRDDLYPGVRRESRGERRGLAVRQEVDHAPALEIDEHRAVPPAAAPNRRPRARVAPARWG